MSITSLPHELQLQLLQEATRTKDHPVRTLLNLAATTPVLHSLFKNYHNELLPTALQHEFILDEAWQFDVKSLLALVYVNKATHTDSAGTGDLSEETVVEVVRSIPPLDTIQLEKSEFKALGVLSEAFAATFNGSPRCAGPSFIFWSVFWHCMNHVDTDTPGTALQTALFELIGITEVPYQIHMPYAWWERLRVVIRLEFRAHLPRVSWIGSEVGAAVMLRWLMFGILHESHRKMIGEYIENELEGGEGGACRVDLSLPDPYVYQRKQYVPSNRRNLLQQ